MIFFYLYIWSDFGIARPSHSFFSQKYLTVVVQDFGVICLIPFCYKGSLEQRNGIIRLEYHRFSSVFSGRNVPSSRL